MKAPTAACALLALLVLSSCASVSQPEPARGPWGKTVVVIEVEAPSAEAVVQYLTTEVGKPLLKEQIQADQRVLWKKLSLKAEVIYMLVEGGVKVIFRLEQITQATQDSDKQFVWGAGVSSGAGVRGTFQFNKHTFLQETVDVNRIDANAPTIVWESEGNNEMRGVPQTGQRR